MTIKEAIYCMECYLPESSEHCGKCRYYGINTGKEGERYCMSSEAHRMAIQALEQEPCEDWYDVPSDEMTLGQARQAVKDLRKKLAEYLWQNPSEDAISREKAIRWVKTECNPYGKPTLDFESGKKVIKHLEQMSSVTPQQTRWIPVSERLPEKNGMYLVTQLRYSLDDIDYKRPTLGKEVDYVKYQDGWCGSRIFDVIAWMPLPEPWKGE